MCEPRALLWTEQAGRALAMIAARNAFRGIRTYTTGLGKLQEPIIPDYTVRDKPAEPVYSGR